MPTAKKKPSAPLTFDLPIDLISKIGSSKKAYRLKSASEVVRLALDKTDLNKLNITTPAHRQISVRISATQRATLKSVAKKKNTSVGELIRFAIEGLPARPKK